MLATGCQVNELLTATQTPTATHSNTYINCRTGASLKLQQGLEGATEQQGGGGGDWSAPQKTRRRNQKINNYYDVAAHPKRDAFRPQSQVKTGRWDKGGGKGRKGEPQKRRGYSRKVRQAHYNSSGVERQTTDEEWGRVGQGGALAYKCNHFVVQTSKTKSEIGKTKGQRRERGCGPTSWLPPFVDCGSRSHSWSRSCALRPTDWPASPPFRKAHQVEAKEMGLLPDKDGAWERCPQSECDKNTCSCFELPPCRPSVRRVGYPLSAIREVHAELARNRLQLHQCHTSSLPLRSDELVALLSQAECICEIHFGVSGWLAR